LAALSRLYEQAERWEELLDVAERVYELADQGQVRAAIRFQMGEILRTRTSDLERAVEAYSEVLDLAPDHDGALASLAIVMGVPFEEAPTQRVDPVPREGGAAEETFEGSESSAIEDAPTQELPPVPALPPMEVRIQAARVLAPRYEATAEYESLLAAYTVLAESDDPEERFTSLRRAAEVADVGLEAPSRAFGLLA